MHEESCKHEKDHPMIQHHPRISIDKPGLLLAFCSLFNMFEDSQSSRSSVDNQRLLLEINLELVQSLDSLTESWNIELKNFEYRSEILHYRQKTWNIC